MSSEQYWRGVIASTRPVRLRGEDRTVKFARQALDGMAAQINQDTVPLNYEHLGFLPPIGRIDTATVRETNDGEFELHVEGPVLAAPMAINEPNFQTALAHLPEAQAPELSIELSYTPRNFDDNVAAEILDDLGSIAHPEERLAALPPLEFALLIPVVWGAAKFAGSFLGALGSSAGNALATKIASWARRSKRPDRTVVFALKFHLQDGSSICGYVLASGEELREAIDCALAASEELAAIAGMQNEMELLPAMKDAAFFLEDGRWNLGWWTDGGTVFRAGWFEEYPPDVDGVLDDGDGE